MEQQTLEDSSNFISRIIGTPYEKMDCFEVAKSYYKHVLGIDLKKYYEYTPEEKLVIQNLIHSNRGDFVRVENPEPGDIALAKIFGIECHILVYIGQGKLLHTTKGTGCVLDRRERWDKTISGYFRLRGKI